MVYFLFLSAQYVLSRKRPQPEAVYKDNPCGKPPWIPEARPIKRRWNRASLLRERLFCCGNGLYSCPDTCFSGEFHQTGCCLLKSIVRPAAEMASSAVLATRYPRSLIPKTRIPRLSKVVFSFSYPPEIINLSAFGVMRQMYPKQSIIIICGKAEIIVNMILYSSMGIVCSVCRPVTGLFGPSAKTARFPPSYSMAALIFTPFCS